MTPRRILIVANQTAAGPHLVRAVKHHMQQGPCTFTLLVPASPPPGTATWTEGQAKQLATERMAQAVAGLREAGADVKGEVGDLDPILAIDDLVRTEAFDEVIISTLPRGRSRWLKDELPKRVFREFGIPTTHVTADLFEPAHT